MSLINYNLSEQSDMVLNIKIQYQKNFDFAISRFIYIYENMLILHNLCQFRTKFFKLKIILYKLYNCYIFCHNKQLNDDS